MNSKRSYFTPKAWLAMMCIMLLSLPLFSQTSTSKITGKVFDTTTNTYAEAASVRVLNAKDGKLVKGMATDNKGVFEFSGMTAGDYRLVISFVGYKTVEKTLTLQSGKNLDLGTIRIDPDATILKGVEVTEIARPIILKQDTVEFNAGSFKVREGAVIEELLKKLPGVEVDAEGNITYNGEKIEKVELDGRNFFSSDPTVATRNLPSLMVDKVQIVDKQSDESRLTGMDDGSRTKVLNLTVKKEMKNGLITNVNGGYGTEQRYQSDMMLNYFKNDARYTLLGNFNNVDGVLRGDGDRDSRTVGFNYETKIKDKLDLTAEASYEGENNNRTGKTVRQTLLDGQQNNTYTEDYQDITRNDRVSSLARLEWTPDSKSTIYFTPEVSWSNSRTQSNQTFSTVDQSDQEINKGSSLTTNESQTVSGAAELHARRVLSPTGRHLYLGLSAGINKSDGSGTNYSLTEFLQNGASEEIDQRLNNTSSSGTFSVRASYVEPLTDKWALQFNYRLSAQNRETVREAFTKDAAGAYTVLDEVYSRTSTNSNQNHALGLNLRYKVKGVQVLVGMDARPSYASTVSTIGSNEVFKKSRLVWNYAPSVRIEYRKSDTLSFNLRYQGRTEHPTMDQLNPAYIVTSALSKVKGNPDLFPSFTHGLRFMGNYNLASKRQNIGTMGWFSYTDNAVIEKRTVDASTGGTEITYENVSGILSANMGMMASTPLFHRNLTFYLFGRVGYDITKSYLNGQLNTAHIFAPSVSPRLVWSIDNLSITFGGRGHWQSVDNSISQSLNRTTVDYTLLNELTWTLPWNISLSSNLAYTEKRGYADGWDTNILLWDMTLSKSFLKNNAATIELSVFDILGQRENFTRSITSSSITDRTVNGVTTYGMLTFKYRFSSFGKGSEPETSTRRFGPQYPGGGSGRPPGAPPRR